MSNEKYWIRHELKQLTIRELNKQYEKLKNGPKAKELNAISKLAEDIYRSYVLSLYREK